MLGLFFANVTGVAEFFANVTACAFDDVTAVVTAIFFDDVTANRLKFLWRKTAAKHEEAPAVRSYVL